MLTGPPPKFHGMRDILPLRRSKKLSTGVPSPVK
jgi:hypothetical protein